MYKILVVSSTEQVLQSKNEFEASGLSFDFLIGAQNSKYDFGKIENQFLNVEGELIPILDNEITQKLTRAQNLKKKNLESQLNQLKHILLPNFKAIKKSGIHKNINLSSDPVSDVIYLKDVIDLTMNPKDKKAYLELKQIGVKKYDHILFEESYLNLSQFSEQFKKQNFYTLESHQVFQFVGLKFKMNEQIGNFKFWFMADSEYSSIYDNIYYISTCQDVMDVWLWLPAQQLKNPTTLEYFSKRARKHLSQKFDFIQLENMSETLTLQPINTYISVQSNFENIMTFMPHFHFFSQDQIKDVVIQLTNEIIKKLKIKKEYIKSQIAEGSL